MTRQREGDVLGFERTFTPEEVRRFAQLSDDEQPRHLDSDDDDRLLVHGLPAATMPTKIGSDLEVFVRSMTFDFHRPVYTGETLTCEMELESVAECEDRYDLVGAVACWNQSDQEALSGTVEGLIRK
jgi:acyl dehydratase